MHATGSKCSNRFDSVSERRVRYEVNIIIDMSSSARSGLTSEILERFWSLPFRFRTHLTMSMHHSDHPGHSAVRHRPWTSSFSVRSLLARPSPVRPRPLTGVCRPRAVVGPAAVAELCSRPLGSSSTLGTTMIEKYIYSLPEYRLHERQRRNFIEIHSFNGLLATRKVIGIYAS